MIFRQLFDSVSSTYTYLLADEKEGVGVYIDTVFENFHRDIALLKELGIKLICTLDTHCHADHITASWLFRKTTGSGIGLSGKYGDLGQNLNLSPGDIIRFGEYQLEVRGTPGHTDGCITLVCHSFKAAFTGDALLIRGAGRTDFQQGCCKTLFKSIKNEILSLPEDYILYPAHDYQGRTSTSVKEEKLWNPRVGGEASEADFIGYMENLNLPHPKQMDLAVPINLKLGEPKDGKVPTLADWGPVQASYAGIWEIDPAWVCENLSKIHLLDVRDPEEFNGELGSIPGAQNIPLKWIAEKSGEIPRDKPVITICRSGKRAAQATVLLKKAGIENVACLTGGMIGWRAEGY